ncbi:unnamed protein product [Aphanomyces euteiches]|uniref:Uncharacterized protein n=1 Tax=Aphanomyces euteiches TaxID=100861 RepID=A0A6G0WJF0_9STRA|nr:hypothetical protein Ae201684_014632 [Aphanomyces euteiches]KAH9081079.1 hypothetical protein Ae201684P_012052 [Aphanomyces euteiches]KAH9135753.1 hypothetical protein AeRB84_018904 [Aphanomyces euteiches]
MDKATRRAAQRQRKAKNGAKDNKNGDYDNNSSMRSPPPRSRSLLQQQDKDQGDGTAVSDSESDDEADSDKETTYHTLIQALNTHLDDADAELKRVEKNVDDDEAATLETVMDFKERMTELKTKVQMIEDGTFAEYCRRCVEFKDDRSRSLETAKQHKELQLKNIQDLRLFDLQRADNLYATAKSKLKLDMTAKVEAMLADVDRRMTLLDDEEEPVNEAPEEENGTLKEEDQVDFEIEEPSLKKPKLDFNTLDLSGPFSDKIKSQKPGYKTLPYGGMTALSVDDVENDLQAICSDWKQLPEKPLETATVHYSRGNLWCGKYIFDEGDEVVVSSKVMKREYIGVIHALSPDAVYLKLNTGEIARVYYTLLQTKRCEIKPILRGNSGLKNLQSSGWVRCEPF